MMVQRCFVLAALLAAGTAHAQFVFPRPEYHAVDPGVYQEDPFIVEYRQKFFSVFRGDKKTFEKAYADITEMSRKDPKDARAMVWLGNGQTIKAGLLLMSRKKAESLALLEKSRDTLDRAVRLKPEDPNIYMMRAVTLYIQGQYWPDTVPRSNWEKLRDDCLKFIGWLGPERVRRASIHVRGETYGELGIAYTKLGDKAKAREAFAKVIELDPNTDYSERAKKEIAKL